MRFLYLLLSLILIFGCDPAKAGNIVVIGSANADTFLKVARLPEKGENLTLLPGEQPLVDVPGGKGCTQAVAAARLLAQESSSKCCFVGQLGGDAAGHTLLQALRRATVDVSHCRTHESLQTGRGYVLLTPSGSVCAVVTGGSNTGGWNDWNDDDVFVQETNRIFKDAQCILLQREIPETINLKIAARAKAKGILVFQDVGGEDRPISSEMLQCSDFLTPNETELKRLTASLAVDGTDSEKNMDTNDVAAEDLDEDTAAVVSRARLLQKLGARNVLVTRGSKGSILVTHDGRIIRQTAFLLPKTIPVVDETGAGDCFRAAFAVALLEGHSLEKCLEFASAAGSCSVQVQGAVPSAPTRSQVEDRLASFEVLQIPRGDGQTETLMGSSTPRGGAALDSEENEDEEDFPFLIGSRLNSMKDRPELFDGPLVTPRDFVKRQSAVRGLTCVDFNYPQHFGNAWTPAEAKLALNEAGLNAGAVCLRFPSKFARGAMNHPDASLRDEAIQLTKEAAEAAVVLGCNEVVVWSAFDGYDYPFQVDYDDKWQQLVDAFREVCDTFPSIKFSLEYKPTDENTRFFTVPTTAAALLLVEEIGRENMGLTLDVGHMLMAGENPGQSISMVGKRKKLFGIQLNDGFTRLAAEDGLMFGSVHPSMALEIMYQLRRTEFHGHLYFDTFPQRTDPVREAEYNILQSKKYWKASGEIPESTLNEVMKEHDAIGALEIVNAALRGMQ